MLTAHAVQTIQNLSKTAADSADADANSAATPRPFFLAIGFRQFTGYHHCACKFACD